MSPPPRRPPTYAAWREPLHELARRIQAAVGAALREAVAKGALSELGRGVRAGAGDTTFALDLPAEAVVEEWLAEQAREHPLSLLSEDSGWEHRGPAEGGWVELEGFDHGGPCVIVDPIDGTRPLMHDLRSAWVVIGFAPPSAGQPRLADVEAGLLVELPTTLQPRARWLEAAPGEPARLWCEGDEDPRAQAAQVLAPGSQDDRVQDGYFTFFRYHPLQRRHLATIEEGFFRRLAELEGSDLRTCYEDGYCSSGAQLALLGLGRYRLIADLRPGLAGIAGPTCKAYDLAGALPIARAAGAVITDPRGEPLDGPLDVTTPVAFVGYANAATQARLEPHLQAALEEAEVHASQEAEL